MPRIVIPGYPHHVTQRGNRRQKTFLCDDDYRFYIELLQIRALSPMSAQTMLRDLS
jgi:REP element-mobilizing transposase RayT